MESEEDQELDLEQAGLAPDLALVELVQDSNLEEESDLELEELVLVQEALDQEQEEVVAIMIVISD